jgi:hypothetical protein
VGDHEATLAGCAKVAAEFGPIDIVVNNAGITRDGTLHKMSFEDWNEVMRINLGGCFNMAKATASPACASAAGGGSSTSARSTARPGNTARSTMPPPSRHSRLHQGAGAGRRAFGVTVNAIAPGYIDTDMVAAVPEPVLEKIVAKIPVGRLGHAEEIARGVAFLVLRGRRLRDRLDHEHQRRPAHVLKADPQSRVSRRRLGTRFLPATKAVPKELLPIVDRPLIQYAVDEAREAGIEQMIFVTGRGKTAIVEHFDIAFELEKTMNERGKTSSVLECTRATPGDVITVRQQVPLGLGHAIWCARAIVGDEPFAIFLPDELMVAREGGTA